MPAPAALVLSIVVASTSLDAAHVALGRALGNDLLDGCSAAQREDVLRNAPIATLGTVGGRRVVLANPQGSCICGNVNCPYLVLRLGPAGTADVLLSTFAYAVTPVGRAQPLPNLRELAHDSALITDETTDAYRNGKYVAVGSARVRGDNGTRKANALPVHFAPGSSSAVLTGSVSAGWYDEFALAAQRGQRITIGGVRSAATLTFSLVDRATAHPVDLRPGVPAVLPAGGTYLLHVDGGGDDPVAYRATVTIR